MTSIDVIIPWRAPAAGPDWTPHRERNINFVTRWYTGYQLDVNPELRLRYCDNGKAIFDRGGSRDLGAQQSKAEFFFFADGDTVIPWRQITEGVQLLRDDPQRWVILYAPYRYLNLTEQATDLVLEHPLVKFGQVDEPSGPAIEHVHDDGPGIMSCAGALLIPREGYFACGGYDPRFGLGWGYEDNAFQLAADTLWGRHVRTDGFAIHLWHPRGEDFNGGWIPHHQRLARQYQRSAGHPNQMRRLVQEGRMPT